MTFCPSRMNRSPFLTSALSFVFHRLPLARLQFALHLFEDRFEFVEVLAGIPLRDFLRSLDFFARPDMNELGDIVRRGCLDPKRREQLFVARFVFRRVCTGIVSSAQTARASPCPSRLRGTPPIPACDPVSRRRAARKYRGPRHARAARPCSSTNRSISSNPAMMRCSLAVRPPDAAGAASTPNSPSSSRSSSVMSFSHCRSPSLCVARKQSPRPCASPTGPRRSARAAVPFLP